MMIVSGGGDDDDCHSDIYIMMQFCLSRKIITSCWESPVTTQVGFHCSRSVLWFFMVIGQVL